MLAEPNRIRAAGLLAATCLLLAVTGCGKNPAGASPTSTVAKRHGCKSSLNPTLKSVQSQSQLVLSGDVCGQGRVRILQRKHGSWRGIGRARADRGGGFSTCAQLRPTGGQNVHLRAVGRHGARAGNTVTLSPQGGAGCGLHLLKEDLGTDPDPVPLWGEILAVSPTRYQWFATGGPDGGPFRRLTARDGDLYHGNSERAELGDSDYLLHDGHLQTFYLYREGMRRVTSFWMRLPSNFPINTDDWQVVMQMKETDPANNTGGTPVISLQATQGQWLLKQSTSSGPASDTRILWRTPATVGVWTHIVVDATYSIDPAGGRYQITIGGARSPDLHTYDLKAEISPPGPGLHPGDPIPSHLRLGIYHDPPMPGTSVDIAQVQIFG